MDYQKIRTNPKQFKALTSLTAEEFDELLIMFAPKWKYFIRKFKLDGKPRTRKYSPKAGDVLGSTEEKLFFILVYEKHNTVQELHAASFSLDQDMCNKWVHVLSPLLNQSLEEYRASRDARSLQDNLSPGGSYIIDGTERPVERDTYGQEQYYSGKKKHIQ